MLPLKLGRPEKANIYFVERLAILEIEIIISNYLNLIVYLHYQ